MTPQIIRETDGKVIRESQALIAGPAFLKNKALEQIIYRLLVLNGIVVVTEGLLLSSAWSRVATLVTASLMLCLLLYRLVFELGKASLKRLAAGFCKSENAMFLASLEKGSEVSQPSAKHQYFMMMHNVAEGTEIRIRGSINPSLQKYWSVIVYDKYGLPLPQYVFDENVHKISSKAGSSGGSEYSYDVCLTRSPASSLHGRTGVTEIDVSTAPVGYVLFRLVHPAEPVENVVRFSFPNVSVEKSPCFLQQPSTKNAAPRKDD